MKRKLDDEKQLLDFDQKYEKSQFTIMQFEEYVIYI